MNKLTINYGIYEYNKEQKEFHRDIMKVLKMKKHKEISADDCMVVFGRCYSVYCNAQLLQEGKIQIKSVTNSPDESKDKSTKHL